MAKPDQAKDEAPSLKELLRWPKAKSSRKPNLTRGIAILSLCIGIFLFIAFVPSRVGQRHSSKPILFAIALYWTGRSIEEIIAARASNKQRSQTRQSRKRSNQSLEPTAGHRDAHI
jgi:hypothetical protein